jgi:hypothetical protein
MNNKSILWKHFSILAAISVILLTEASMAQPFLVAENSLYADHSVLATGIWVKISTSSNGIYRISHDDLKSFGLEPSAINPKNIKLYGNGGGMLPEGNSASRIDDLAENAIFVAGEEDGKFDPGDYILFYGQSPDRWIFQTNDQSFRFQKNVYSDKVYYFLTVGSSAGKRIQSIGSVSQSATHTADRFDDYSVYEREEVNLIKSGRQWWDKQYFDMTTTRNYSFSFPDIDPTSPVSLFTHLAARSSGAKTSFSISAQSIFLKTVDIDPIAGTYDSDFAREVYTSATFTTASPSIDIKLTYNKSSSSSIGYLDYIQLNARRQLKMNGNQMLFRAAEGVKPDGVTDFRLSTQGQSIKVWEVTSGQDVGNITLTQSGNQSGFRLQTSMLREFIAFDGQAFYSVEFTGKVINQDLHGIEVPDYVILAPPVFQQEALRLAQFHETNSGLSVFVTTPETVYNEFSSGSQDVTAIRDFMRMLYKKSTPDQGLRYLLLFGDASYDYKNRTQNNTNLVPTYQSVASLSPTSSFASDDYFGLLDNQEGQSANGEIDLGIGRFPVDNTEQAKQVVAKVLHYCSNSDTVKNDWRNVVTFVSDDQNEGGNLFVEDSEDLANVIEKNYPYYNVDKIYSDAYTMLSTPGGARYPEVNEAITKRVEKGSLLVNYVGHGGELGWAHERILEVPDIKSWTNYSRMPVFVTATCEFSRFDDPERVSAGEWVLLNSKGGGVALFTTSRLTYAGTNKSLLVNFYNQVFRQTNGEYMKMGDLLVASKKGMGSSANIHAFVLLGDPAMQIAYPSLKAVTTSITTTGGIPVNDTLRALAQITISGEIRLPSGAVAANFNGTVFPSVFDKASESWTKANQNEGPPVRFYLSKNLLYKGKSEVKDGHFSFTFVVPKDISYKYGPGKISYYAKSTETDANGAGTIQVGGYNNAAHIDDEGPVVSLFMNNRSFRPGGMTSQSPVLVADVADSSGINTVGNGIGHDITAILDNKSTEPMILNDYYVSDLNTFKSGVISYPLGTLSEGPHTITLKVWDVYNNSTTESLDFIVVPSAEYALDHLYNYPNPMVDNTTFAWESNQTNQPLEAEISVFTLQGELIKTLRSTYQETGFRQNSMGWDGTRDHGGRISAGMYVYRLRLMLSDGTTKFQTSKLVVVNR